MLAVDSKLRPHFPYLRWERWGNAGSGRWIVAQTLNSLLTSHNSGSTLCHSRRLTALYQTLTWILLIPCWWSHRGPRCPIYGLVPARRNSIANALEFRLSCTKPSSCQWIDRLVLWTDGLAIRRHVYHPLNQWYWKLRVNLDRLLLSKSVATHWHQDKMADNCRRYHQNFWKE